MKMRHGPSQALLRFVLRVSSWECYRKRGSVPRVLRCTRFWVFPKPIRRRPVRTTPLFLVPVRLGTAGFRRFTASGFLVLDCDGLPTCDGLLRDAAPQVRLVGPVPTADRQFAPIAPVRTPPATQGVLSPGGPTPRRVASGSESIAPNGADRRAVSSGGQLPRGRRTRPRNDVESLTPVRVTRARSSSARVLWNWVVRGPGRTVWHTEPVSGS